MKLWSWVSLYFKMVFPLLSIVSWLTMFIGANRVPGMEPIQDSGSGRLKPCMTLTRMRVVERVGVFGCTLMVAKSECFVDVLFSFCPDDAV